MLFSKRIIFFYTTLILVPLFVGIIIFTSNIQNRQISDAQRDNEQFLYNNIQKVEKNLESFAQLESAANANEDFMFFLLNKSDALSTSDIESYKAESKALSRLLLVLPDMYALRFFVDNENIPESWPVILSSKRFNASKLRKWEFNFVANFMGYFNQYMEKSVCLTKPLLYKGNKIGNIQIAMKMEDFFPFLFEKNYPNINNYIFSIENGEFIQITNEEIDKLNTPLTSKEIDLLEIFYDESPRTYNSFRMHTSYGSTIFSYQYNPRLNIIIFSAYNLNNLNLSFLWLKCLAVLILIITFFVFYFVIKYATMRLLNRVFLLMNGLKEVEKGNLDIQLKIDGNDEITDTQIAFNKMINQLKLQIKQIEHEHELAADTEVKAMQNQINAHFLYNVLETIKMQAVLNDQDDIAESLTVLGKMMRYCLRWRVHKVPLQQEIDYALSYVYILNLRNDYVLDLEINIDSEFLNVEVPKMILQPIIENSFIHAIEPFGKDSQIKISTKYDSNKKVLYICAKDFGPGIPPEKLELLKNYLTDSNFEKKNKGGIGLKNIQQRLEMFYGKQYTIQIQSVVGEGTSICIPIPIEQNQNSNY